MPESLKERYEEVCMEYVNEFCGKQEMEFGGWTADLVGGIAFCNDFTFDFFDIKLDVDTKQKVGTIIDWYYDNIEIPFGQINYYSYTKGNRVADINNGE